MGGDVKGLDRFKLFTSKILARVLRYNCSLENKWAIGNGAWATRANLQPSCSSRSVSMDLVADLTGVGEEVLDMIRQYGIAGEPEEGEGDEDVEASVEEGLFESEGRLWFIPPGSFDCLHGGRVTRVLPERLRFLKSRLMIVCRESGRYCLVGGGAKVYCSVNGKSLRQVEAVNGIHGVFRCQDTVVQVAVYHSPDDGHDMARIERYSIQHDIYRGMLYLWPEPRLVWAGKCAELPRRLEYLRDAMTAAVEKMYCRNCLHVHYAPDVREERVQEAADHFSSRRHSQLP
ncbi:MAG: hypothetical protein PHD72_02610 [Patescibacteria group bacterium]|nr:hypothetical protein [Patescibacteria group bacterium]